LIVIFCGLPGVGKTTVAEKLAPLIDALILSSDKIRKELIPQPTYERYERELVYHVMMLLAKYLHKVGKNCILDATFNKEEFRNQVKKKTHCSDDQFFIVECSCPEDMAVSRIKHRKGGYSDANVATYLRMKKIYEDVKAEHLRIDTLKDADINAKIIEKEIKKKLNSFSN
jgi:predicted kinase